MEKGATSCETCGSCPETGWSEESIYDGLDLPGEFGEETPTESSAASAKRPTVVAVILLLVVLYVFVFR